MNPVAIFWPVIAQAALTFIVYALLGLRRRRAIATGEVKAGQFKLRGVDPESTAAVSNNLMNQFEVPVLFYVVCICLYVTVGVNLVVLVLAWLFVLSRYLHAWIHLTGNNVIHRFNAFGFGLMVLVVMWIAFAIHLLTA
ncbi:MAG: MAPEG family protein [Rhizobiaceae bacterium]|nr:MAPEG family protein [Rhizobiaceae bacterium]